MGFLDNVTSAVNRGTAAAGRGADKIKLNARISELNKQRQNLAAQLGASLYEATRNDPALRAGREALYDGIAQVDAEREACKAQIVALDAQANAAANAAAGFTCAVCGAHMSGADLFCSGCGTPAEQARGAGVSKSVSGEIGTGLSCPSCGALINKDDVFCMGCGTRLEGVSDESNVSSASTGSEIQEAAEIAAGAVEVAKVGSSNTPDTEEPLGSLASAEAPKGDSETGEGAATKESDGK